MVTTAQSKRLQNLDKYNKKKPCSFKGTRKEGNAPAPAPKSIFVLSACI